MIVTSYSTWWMMIFCTFFRRTPMLLQSNEQTTCISMSSLMRHDLCETVCNLLTVTLDLQDAVTCSTDHACTKWIFVSTRRVRRLAPLRFTEPRAADLSAHNRAVQTSTHLAPLALSGSDSPELKQTMFWILDVAYTSHHVSFVLLSTLTAIPQ